MFSFSKPKPPTMGVLLCASAFLLSSFNSLARADTETNIHDFGGSDGANPVGRLVAAGDGTFYGAAQFGGATGLGCVFKITESGTETVLHNFGNGTPQSDGLEPAAGVIVGKDGMLYGTTTGGGADGFGTVYKMTPAGVVTILHSFAGTTDGAIPETPLTFGKDGRLYGTTSADSEYENSGDGTVFSMNTDGSNYIVQCRFATMANVRGTLTLAPGSSTALYGTASTYGGAGEGALFSIIPGTADGSGALKVLHTFSDGSVAYDGSYPNGALIVDTAGNIYGTTFTGGANDNGTAYKYASTGAYTVLYSFDDLNYLPAGGLILGSDGNFYGTTERSTEGNGSVYSLSTTGSFNDIYDFGDYGNYNGSDPIAPPTEDSNGNFIGLTNQGGDGNDDGAAYTLTAVLSNPVKVSSVALSPTGVVGGSANSKATITLAQPAPSGGAVVILASSNMSAATVPASVTVAANSETATFTVTSHSVVSNASATITATYNSSSASANLTVSGTGPALSALTLSPTSVAGGASTTANTVTLSAPATAGTTVTLSSSNTSAAAVPASVVIASNVSSANFTINTSAVTAIQKVTITAKYNGNTETATLTVTPPPIALQSVVLSPASTNGGTSTTANRIYLTGDAAANTVVTLASSNTNVATLAANTVTISSGASSHTFTINTKAVTSTQTVTILANYNGVTQMSTLTVTPTPTPLMVSSVTLSPTGVIGGQANSTGTVTLNAAAPAGGAIVTLGSSDQSASVPSTVTVAAGATSAAFTITTSAITAQTSATISAIYGGAYQFATLTVNPPASSGATLKSVTLSPVSTKGGSAATTANRVSFTSAPTSNQTVTLTSSNTAVATVPSTVTVDSGSTSRTFTTTTKAVTSQQTVTITATSGGVTQTATLTVTP